MPCDEMEPSDVLPALGQHNHGSFSDEGEVLRLLLLEKNRYRRLFEAITSYTYSVTFGDGASCTRHGLGCLATTGYSPDEYAADGYLWIRIVHPEDRERVFARLMPGTRSLVAVNAGHRPGYVLDRSGRIKAHIRSTTLPLAVLAEAQFPPCDPVALEPGDIVLLFTDGIPEARSPQGAAFGAARMLKSSPRIVIGRPRKSSPRSTASKGFCRPGKPCDDITAIVIKVGPEAEG